MWNEFYTQLHIYGMNTASEKYQFVPIFENFIHLLGLSSTMTMYPSLLAFLLSQK
jgi:hypothetical protein